MTSPITPVSGSHQRARWFSALNASLTPVSRGAARSPLAKTLSLVFCCSVFAVLTLWPTDAQAYTWMIRHGYAKCTNCHTDPSGGETLNHMGRVTSQTLLSQKWGDGELSDSSKFLFGLDEPDALNLGGSYRGMGIYDLDSSSGAAFPMQADLYGNAQFGDIQVAASVGASRASGRWEHTDKAVLVGDLTDDSMVAVSRSHWIGYNLNDVMLLRAGRIALPFGLRLTEHTQWVRDETLTDRESDHSHGLAFAYWGGSIRAELMLAAGNFQLRNARNREKGYSTYLEYLLDSRTALGVSSLYMVAEEGLKSGIADESRGAHGVTARYSPLQPLVLLAEANALVSSYRSLGYVGMLTADFEPVQGIHLMATGEALNRGESETVTLFPAGPGMLPPAPTPEAIANFAESDDPGPGRGETRLGGWLTVNWFPVSHVDLRVDMVARQNRPLTLLMQGHLYF